MPACPLALLWAPNHKRYVVRGSIGTTMMANIIFPRAAVASTREQRRRTVRWVLCQERTKNLNSSGTPASGSQPFVPLSKRRACAVWKSEYSKRRLVSGRCRQHIRSLRGEAARRRTQPACSGRGRRQEEEKRRRGSRSPTGNGTFENLEPKWNETFTYEGSAVVGPGRWWSTTTTGSARGARHGGDRGKLDTGYDVGQVVTCCRFRG